MDVGSKEWIDWYFESYFTGFERDRKNKIPLTKEHIGMCVARLPYKENEKKGAMKWSDEVYAASLAVFKELYAYALETEGLMPSDTSFEDFMDWIHSEDFYKEVGSFGNQFG